jgi:hypothetical protein
MDPWLLDGGLDDTEVKRDARLDEPQSLHEIDTWIHDSLVQSIKVSSCEVRVQL